MTDIEENTWQEGLCKHCGVRLRGKQRVLRLSANRPQDVIPQVHPSRCFENWSR